MYDSTRVRKGKHVIKSLLTCDIYIHIGFPNKRTSTGQETPRIPCTSLLIHVGRYLQNVHMRPIFKEKLLLLAFYNLTQPRILTNEKQHWELLLRNFRKLLCLSSFPFSPYARRRRNCACSELMALNEDWTLV